MTEHWLYQIRAEPVLPEASRPEALRLKWFKPLNEPPDEIERYLATLYDQWAAQEALVFGVNSWDNNAQAWDDSTTDWDGNPIVPAPDLSFQSPWREPVAPLEELHTSLHQTTAIDPFHLLDPERTQVDKWYKPLSEPVLPLDPIAHLDASGGVHQGEPSLFVVSELVTMDKWFKPLSEPADEITPLPEGAKQSFVIDTLQLLQPESITVDKWFKNLNEPVLPPFDPNLLGINHFFYVPEPILLETITMDKWWKPLRDPSELRDLGLPVALIPAFIADAQLFCPPWVPDAPLDGVWSAEGAAAGVWASEGSASGAWTEENKPPC
jgi:hypothetical protein